jgi:hypothetical protein
MKRVNVSVKNMSRFAGMWVAIKDDQIIAVAKEFKQLHGIVTGTKKNPPQASAFKVPKKGEGPYVLFW